MLTQNRRILIALICALGVTLFLFYIDEGYYNFRWMQKPANWIPFFFYSGTILGIQLLVTEVILIKFSAQVKTMSAIILTIGILILMIVTFAR